MAKITFQASFDVRIAWHSKVPLEDFKEIYTSLRILKKEFALGPMSAMKRQQNEFLGSVDCDETLDFKDVELFCDSSIEVSVVVGEETFKSTSSLVSLLLGDDKIASEFKM